MKSNNTDASIDMHRISKMGRGEGETLNHPDFDSEEQILMEANPGREECF